jgi:hypothetical protein
MEVIMTATLKEPNGRKFTKRVENATEAAALAEMTALLTITAGELVAVKRSTEVVGLTNAGDVSYSDATFHFRNGTNDYNVHFEQLPNSYAMVDSEGNETGYVDVSEANILAWANARGSGTLVEGKYVR